MREPDRNGRKACVVGAGLTGLVAAHSLSRSGYAVTVLESELRPGGMLSTFRIGWEDLERIPHRIGPGDRAVLGLYEDLGLAGQVEWYHPYSSVYLHGAHHALARPSDALRIRNVPLGARLRAAASAAVRGLPPGRCEESLRALSGGDALPEEWRTACRTRAASGPRTRDEAGYPAGGFAVLVRMLVKEIEARGGEVRCGCTVTDIRPSGGGFRLDCILEDCTAYSFDADQVVATVSGRRFAEMGAGAGLPEPVLERLRATRDLGHMSLALRLKAPLSPFHRTLVPAGSAFRLVTEHSGLVGLRRYGGHIVYLSRDVDTAEPIWTQSDGEVFRLFFRSLTEMHPALLRSDVKDWRLTRIRYACPTDGAFRGAGPPFETGCPGLFLAELPRTLPEEHSLDRSIRSGFEAADRVRREPSPTADGTAVPAVSQKRGAPA